MEKIIHLIEQKLQEAKAQVATKKATISRCMAHGNYFGLIDNVQGLGESMSLENELTELLCDAEELVKSESKRIAYEKAQPDSIETEGGRV